MDGRPAVGRFAAADRLPGTAAAGGQLSAPRASRPDAAADRARPRGLPPADEGQARTVAEPRALLRDCGALDAADPDRAGARARRAEARRRAARASRSTKGLSPAASGRSTSSRSTRRSNGSPRSTPSRRGSSNCASSAGSRSKKPPKRWTISPATVKRHWTDRLAPGSRASWRGTRRREPRPLAAGQRSSSTRRSSAIAAARDAFLREATRRRSRAAARSPVASRQPRRAPADSSRSRRGRSRRN